MFGWSWVRFPSGTVFFVPRSCQVDHLSQLSLTGHVHIKKVVLKGKSALTFELFYF